MSSAYDDISLILSSCGRFKLLFKTIKSMQPWINQIPQKIIVEDSGIPEDVPIKKLESMGFTVLINPKRLGQHRSLDIAYAQANQKYIFHCEDDWKFFAEPDINFAKKVLGNHNISCFCFRKSGDRDPTYPCIKRFRYDDWETSYVDSKPFKIPPTVLIFQGDPRWLGYTFVPHLAREEIYRKEIRKFTLFPEEPVLSRYMKKKNFTIAAHPKGYCFHIGWRNLPQDPTKTLRSKPPPPFGYYLPPYNTQIIVRLNSLYAQIQKSIKTLSK